MRSSSLRLRNFSNFKLEARGVQVAPRVFLGVPLNRKNEDAMLKACPSLTNPRDFATTDCLKERWNFFMARGSA